ncbi:MAG: hypothetical protein HGA67_03765 [Candidatus Yonathbacteria bacterium]|nr:hypothetical protein [Candidatus Yonathbacteria bacterium]
MKKTTALLALAISLIAFVYSVWPLCDLMLTIKGINFDIPFMTINETTFRVYGIDLVGYEPQWGFIMLSGMCATLTGMLFYLALLQTWKRLAC